MGHPKQVRRFKINPVELVVFGAVTLIFANSVYQLYYDWEEIRTNVVGSTPALAQSDRDGRSIASNNPLFSTIEVKCDEKSAAKKKPGSSEALEVTDAAKIRLSGPLCGPGKADKTKLLKAEVVNRTTNSTATVFTNSTDGSFSTDFIQLSPGRNQIQLKWVYQGGKEHSQALVIQKN
jgi:hypothetical protein